MYAMINYWVIIFLKKNKQFKEQNVYKYLIQRKM